MLAPTIASASGSRSGLLPAWIALTARPTSHGISTVSPIAAQAKTNEPQQLAPVGTEKAQQTAVGAHPTDYTK